MTDFGGKSDGTLRRLAFSSDQLPAKLSDRARRNMWRDAYQQLYGPLDVDYANNRPFNAHLDFTGVGGVECTRIRSSVERFVRTRRCVEVAGNDDLALVINQGTKTLTVHQLGREARAKPGDAVLVSNGLAGRLACGPNPFLFLQCPRSQLLQIVSNADNLISTSFDRRLPALRHLRGYLGLLQTSDGPEDDPLLDHHIETTLIDIFALVLAAKRDAAALAHMRGLRAARLQMILAAIQAGYDDPAFSVHALAKRVGLSSRYAQNLLHEAGLSFTHRVLELRLQKARAMLVHRRFAHYRIIDIALASGFNEVSHFNRAFRRRFATAPSTLRAR